MVSYTVYYFPIRGRAELIRLVFEAAGVTYANKYPTNWPAEKPNLPFGQLPALIVHDDNTHADQLVAQTSAIVRHLAAKFDLVHADEHQRLLADGYYESIVDLQNAVVKIVYKTPEEQKGAAKAEFLATTLPAFVAAHTKFLKANGENGFYFAGKLTYLELALFAQIGAVNVAMPGAITAENAPALIKVRDAVAQNDKVKAYLASERYHKH
ncbi:hypothetical protein H9P43_005091 [Blastocladiella emersonii ATCC 22665]|nr:hypothetical protein H9P43_005091 [Blastocladiella emersonii ATCC 22665]